MNPLVGVCGAHGSGKTLVILGMLTLMRIRGGQAGAFKPVDSGMRESQARDEYSDGELFQQVGCMPEHISLINPYLLHERLPPQLAALRDGVCIDLNLLDSRLKQLRKRYQCVIIESPGGLLTPIAKDKSWASLLNQWAPDIIWVSGIGETELEHTLVSVDHLLSMELNVRIMLNNNCNIRNAELIQYQWLTLEENLSVPVIGLLPFLPDGLENHERVAGVLADYMDKGRNPGAEE